MTKTIPDHHDAQLAFRAYDLRREPVMRASRSAINGGFWPRSYEELFAVTKPDHPQNAAYRQVATYWEMIYGTIKHGIVHADYFLESNGEGLFLFAKVQPFLEPYRKDVSPYAFQNAEWVSKECETGRRLLALLTQRVQTYLATPR